MNSPTPLLAFLVKGEESSEIVFAADQKSLSYSPEDCSPAPQFDKFAPGPAPLQALLDDGWWLDCHQCGRRITAEGVDADKDEEEGTAQPFSPVIVKQSIYCGQSCHDQYLEELRVEKEQRQLVEKGALQRWPGIQVTSSWAFRKEQAGVEFRFPGGLGRTRWDLGSDCVYVERRDLDAWREYRKRGELAVPVAGD
jgi:hypothetical protein